MRVRLDLLVDDRLVGSFLADVFLQTLLDTRVGNGAHGFVAALGGLKVRPEAVIRVRVTGRVVELGNSGQRLECYRIAPA